MKGTIISVAIMLILIGGSFWLSKSGGNTNQTNNVVKVNNVTIVDGKQVIEIEARGGYQPRKSYAKAGIPTIIRFSTNGTFDCSSFVRIPSLNVSQSLPQTGKTDISIGSPQISTLKGSCGMGMYPFEVEFTS
jgi:hypothetical protein